MKNTCGFAAVIAGAMLISGVSSGQLKAASDTPVGQLVAQTGSTAQVASAYGQGVADAFAYINRSGGINGHPVALDTVDYGYDVTRALGTYKNWKETLKPVAIQGWGTADTEALVDNVSKDAIVFMSGSSSGHLTDPTGRSPWTSTPAPYNFFYGPSYSDGCRGLVQWAAEDWRRSGSGGRSTFLGDLDRPKFVFMGDNHPYPNSPKAACTDYVAQSWLRSSAADPLFVVPRRLCGAVPVAEKQRRAVRFPRQHCGVQHQAGEGLRRLGRLDAVHDQHLRLG